MLVEKGQARFLGQVVNELECSSIIDSEKPNGEFVHFADALEDGFHVTYLLLTETADPDFPGLLGELTTELPLAIDTDEDGIPDLTDPPAPLWLRLNRNGTGLTLQLEGEANWTFQLQRASALTAFPVWTTVESITLTHSPQTVPLSDPGTGTAYWRLAEAL